MAAVLMIVPRPIIKFSPIHEFGEILAQIQENVKGS
jgi:hypothetical protein